MGSQLWAVTKRVEYILEVPKDICRQLVKTCEKVALSSLPPSTLGKADAFASMRAVWSRRLGGHRSQGWWDLEAVVAKGCWAELSRNIPNAFHPEKAA